MKKHSQLVTVGRHIQKLRREMGYSQEDFAAEAGLDRAYYGSIERGDRNVGILNLVKIAKALNVEMGELFPKINKLK